MCMKTEFFLTCIGKWWDEHHFANIKQNSNIEQTLTCLASNKQTLNNSDPIGGCDGIELFSLIGLS